MNSLQIIVQTKEDPKNLLSSKEKVDALPEGVTVVFIEGGTSGTGIGVEFIVKGKDLYGNQTVVGSGLTERNMDALMGAFVGVRMRFLRMPPDQYIVVRNYLKDQVNNFMKSLSKDKLSVIEKDIKRYFGIS